MCWPSAPQPQIVGDDLDDVAEIMPHAATAGIDVQ
jgi:hypothetical protein